MAKKALITSTSLRVSAPRLIDAALGTQVYLVTAILDDGSVESVTFELPENSAIAPSPSIRTSLLTFLLPAMRMGARLVVDEPIDAQTYQNLMEYQEAVVAWEPQKLQKIVIDAQVEITPIRRPLAIRPNGLTAFSGGVDSCHTLWMHSPRAPIRQMRQAELGAGLMVHGLDISFDQSQTFESAFERSRLILESHGVASLRMRTDIRRLEHLFGVSWSYQGHGMFLAACLSFFEQSFDVVLIPSTYAYSVLKFPWGSNPISDPLMGGGTPIWHDGAAYLKHQKVRDIAADLAVQKYLRVCWEGDQLDRNCGYCFKCMATQAAFWCAGVERPECFDNFCSVDDLRNIPIKNAPNRYLVDKMREQANVIGRHDIASALSIALINAGRKKWQRWLYELLRRS